MSGLKLYVSIKETCVYIVKVQLQVQVAADEVN